MKLNLGCGVQIVIGWINVDYSAGARFTKFPLFSLLNKKIKLFNISWSKEIFLHNLTKKFPWTDNSVDVIYTSHTLEHFTREDGHKFLAECYRVLKKGGVLRVIVPDLSIFVKKYINGEI